MLEVFSSGNNCCLPTPYTPYFHCTHNDIPVKKSARALIQSTELAGFRIHSPASVIFERAIYLNYDTVCPRTIFHFFNS